MGISFEEMKKFGEDSAVIAEFYLHGEFDPVKNTLRVTDVRHYPTFNPRLLHEPSHLVTVLVEQPLFLFNQLFPLTDLILDDEFSDSVVTEGYDAIVYTPHQLCHDVRQMLLLDATKQVISCVEIQSLDSISPI